MQYIFVNIFFYSIGCLFLLLVVFFAVQNPFCLVLIYFCFFCLCFLVKVSQSYPTLCDPMDCSPRNSAGQNTGVGSCSFLQGIFPTQGSNPGLPLRRWILYLLRDQGSPCFQSQVQQSIAKINTMVIIPCILF